MFNRVFNLALLTWLSCDVISLIDRFACSYQVGLIVCFDTRGNDPICCHRDLRTFELWWDWIDSKKVQGIIYSQQELTQLAN